MTQATRTERYEANACIDHEDAQAMSGHLLAIATLANRKGAVAMASCDHQTALHFTRLVRIMQRATQPDVVGRAPCLGVSRIVQSIENGVPIFTVGTSSADIVINTRHRTISLNGPTGQVVQLDQYEHRRRA